jgi:hypothetical protein
MLVHDSAADNPDSLLPPDDHRALLARLDLGHFQDEAPGMVFWHPRGSSSACVTATNRAARCTA